MTNAKVKVTKEVAEAIGEIIKRNNGNKAHAVGGFFNRPFTTNKLSPLNALSDDEGIQAIYFGYEIDKTPEEKIIAEWERLSDVWRTAYHHDDCGDMRTADAKQSGIKFALDMLGIKYKGVNA